MAGDRFLQNDNTSHGYSPAAEDEDVREFSPSSKGTGGDTGLRGRSQEDRERQRLTAQSQDDEESKADVRRMARLFLLIGIATTFPWNSLLTSLPIFTITYFPTYKWGMWTAQISAGANLLAQPVLRWLMRRVTLGSCYLVSTSLLLVSTILVPLLGYFFQKTPTGFVLALSSIFLLASAAASLQATAFVLSAAVPDERYLFRFFVGQGGAGVLAAVCGILPYLVKRLIPSQAISTFSFIQTSPSVLLPFSEPFNNTTTPSSSSSLPSFPGIMLQLDLEQKGGFAQRETTNLSQSTGTSLSDDNDDKEEVRWSLYSSVFVFSICICILLICAFSYRALKSSRLFSHLLEHPQSTSSSSSPPATRRVPYGLDGERRRGREEDQEDQQGKKNKKTRTAGRKGASHEEETIPLAEDESPPHRRRGEEREEEEERRRRWMNDENVNGATLNDVSPMKRQMKGKGHEEGEEGEGDLHVSVIPVGEKEKDKGAKTWADRRVQAEIRNAFLVFFVSGVLFPAASAEWRPPSTSPPSPTASFIESTATAAAASTGAADGVFSSSFLPSFLSTFLTAQQLQLALASCFQVGDLISRVMARWFLLFDTSTHSSSSSSSSSTHQREASTGRRGGTGTLDNRFGEDEVNGQSTIGKTEKKEGNPDNEEEEEDGEHRRDKRKMKSERENDIQHNNDDVNLIPHRDGSKSSPLTIPVALRFLFIPLFLISQLATLPPSSVLPSSFSSSSSSVSTVDNEDPTSPNHPHSIFSKRRQDEEYRSGRRLFSDTFSISSSHPSPLRLSTRDGDSFSQPRFGPEDSQRNPLHLTPPSSSGVSTPRQDLSEVMPSSSSPQTSASFLDLSLSVDHDAYLDSLWRSEEEALQKMEEEKKKKNRLHGGVEEREEEGFAKKDRDVSERPRSLLLAKKRRRLSSTHHRPSSEMPKKTPRTTTSPNLHSSSSPFSSPPRLLFGEFNTPSHSSSSPPPSHPDSHPHHYHPRDEEEILASLFSSSSPSSSSSSSSSFIPFSSPSQEVPNPSSFSSLSSHVAFSGERKSDLDRSGGDVKDFFFWFLSLDLVRILLVLLLAFTNGLYSTIAILNANASAHAAALLHHSFYRKKKAYPACSSPSSSLLGRRRERESEEDNSDLSKRQKVEDQVTTPTSSSVQTPSDPMDEGEKETSRERRERDRFHRNYRHRENEDIEKAQEEEEEEEEEDVQETYLIRSSSLYVPIVPEREGSGVQEEVIQRARQKVAFAVNVAVVAGLCAGSWSGAALQFCLPRTM
ncbi:transmembrane protein [Cystoisospora suis]|uniref:Transmembrane protein n=1 Tax=Cystoisospora suis TaxID=483139 RepID=A0A2C6JY60_9APIC|nr:transmembrane protein [Cystoisospora suis]